MEMKCLECGKVFNTKPVENRKYCSYTCYRIHRIKEEQAIKKEIANA